MQEKSCGILYSVENRFTLTFIIETLIPRLGDYNHLPRLTLRTGEFAIVHA